MANYTESLLASGERIVRNAHAHWFVLVAKARYGILGIVLALLLLVLASVANVTGSARDALGLLTLVLFVYGVASLAWSVLQFRNEEYLITNRRLIHAEGVINKKTTDSSLEKINDAVLTESLAGRIFGFGDLDVLTASEEGIDRLRMLRDAKQFKKAMIEAKHELEVDISRPTMPPLRTFQPASAEPAPPPPAFAPSPAPVATMSARTDEVADALDRLGDLRDRGLITPDEFDAKKRELLDRL